MPVLVVAIFIFCIWASMSVLARAASSQSALVAGERESGLLRLSARPGDDLIGVSADLPAWTALDDLQLDRLLKSQR